MQNELDRLVGLAGKGRISRRDFLGRAAALGASAALATTLAGKAFAATPVKGGLLRAGLQGGESTNSLDPALNLSQVTYSFCKQWGEFLVRLTPDNKLVNLIAEEIGASKDAKTWTIKVRDGIEFHNGKTVGAEDVAATIERHADEKSKSGALGILKNIKGVKASGKEVIVSLGDADADFPYLMADYHLVIQPNGGKDNPNAGISAGPYKVTVNQPGVKHGGERFANYWRGDKAGHADQIEIVVINDATARLAALQGGQVHMINRVEPKVVDLVKRIPGVSIENASGKGYYPFNMFCDTAPFDSADLRMALKLAMDRDEMLEKILRGYGSVGNDFPINEAYPLFTALEQRKFDPEKAAALYKKSGHSGSILLRTSDVAFPGAVDAAQLYQQSAAKAGIKQGRHQDRDQARARRRLLVGSLEQAALLALLLGRPRHTGPDVRHRLCLDRRLERYAVQEPGVRQDALRRARRARPGQAQGDLPRHGNADARRRRADRAVLQPVHRRGRFQQDRRFRQEPDRRDDGRLRACRMLAEGLMPAYC